MEVASYSLSSGSGEAERILDSTVVQEYAYVYNGSSLMQMVVQTTVDDGAPTTDTLYFSYDASGIPMSLVYNGTDYYYTVSLQGDVTAILNTSGTAVVEYTYDAWGNILSVTGSMADTLGAVNPLTYRGYVYDTETGLYYLQSRYYNPETGRFLNADGYMATGQGLLGNNMFAYCLNNPINRIDVDGSSGIWTFLFYTHYMGYIHWCVEQYIKKEYKHMNVVTEMGLGAAGRADVVVGDAVWEIKHGGRYPELRKILAKNQAKRYVIESSQLNRLGDAYMFSGTFYIFCMDQYYRVYFETPEYGVILYYVSEACKYNYEMEYERIYKYDQKKKQEATLKTSPLYNNNLIRNGMMTGSMGIALVSMGLAGGICSIARTVYSFN